MESLRPVLQEFLIELGITADAFEANLKEELHCLETLKTERIDNPHHVEYVRSLQNLQLAM